MFGQRIANLDEYIAEKSRRKGVNAAEAVLTATSYEVEVRSGLAFVKLTRCFENKEAKPIEAVMTFPVPYAAAVTRITTEIDGRKLVGQSQAKAKARETYENAIDEGKSAILHEQLLKGIHMVSVANVKPSAKIEVVAHFVTPVSMSGKTAKVRIPLTIGQIYGNLPMQDTDRLVADGPETFATIKISAATPVMLNGRSVSGDVQTISLATVIDIQIEDHELKPLSANTKDGRVVTLDFAALGARSEPCEFDLLLDASGSMQEVDNTGKMKWTAMLEALAKVESLGLIDGDKINLWSFATNVYSHGSATKADLATKLRAIPFAKTQTHLDTALETVAKSREGTNILIATDGRAGSLDFDKLLQRGMRATAVLMGGDALEANVSYLADVSGGQTFVSFGRETERDFALAINSMGHIAPALPVGGSRPGQVTRNIAGVAIKATWKTSKKSFEEIDGLSAFAAYLALASMPEDKASVWAAEEGLVSHLTSIVLVDEAGEAVDGVPAHRKVPLAEPVATFRSMSMLDAGAPMAASSMQFAASSSGRFAKSSVNMMAANPSRNLLVGSGHVQLESALPDAGSWGLGSDKHTFFDPNAGINDPMIDIVDLQALLKLPTSGIEPPATWRLKSSLETAPIDWDAHSDALLAAEIDKLPLSIRARLKAIMTDGGVIGLATKYKLPVAAVAVGLIAYVDKDKVRTADRIQRRHLKDVPVSAVLEVLFKL